MGEFFNSGGTVGPIERYFQNLRLTGLLTVSNSFGSRQFKRHWTIVLSWSLGIT